MLLWMLIREQLRLLPVLLRALGTMQNMVSSTPNSTHPVFQQNIQTEKSLKPVWLKAFCWRALGDSNPRPFDS